jgi:hypothetical protein
VYSKKKEGEAAFLEIEDPRRRWYCLLKLSSPTFGDRSYGEQLNDDGTSAGFIYTGSLTSIADASANLCLALQASHPIVERKGKWQWLHDNYIKALVVGAILAVVGAGVKLMFKL